MNASRIICALRRHPIQEVEGQLPHCPCRRVWLIGGPAQAEPQMVTLSFTLTPKDRRTR